MKNIFKKLGKKTIIAILTEAKAALASGPRRYDDSWTFRETVMLQVN